MIGGQEQCIRPKYKWADEDIYKKADFDFVVKENIFNRTKHLFDNHKTAVTVVIAIIFLVIYKSCLKDSEILNAIYEILQFMRG